jgi:GAF domain-containing protein
MNDTNREVEERESTLEQAALRRIATLVAQGVQPSDLFAVVAEEVARVIDVPYASIARYEPDDTVTACASVSPQGAMLEFGTRWPLADSQAVRLVHERSASARLDDYTEVRGELADTLRRSGITSTVAVPIMVSGQLWGAITASDADRLPEDAEARLVEFTPLLATAIANAESDSAVTRLVEEQAALRRVATLVAKEDLPERVFAKVAEETGRLFGGVECTLMRKESDGEATNVGSWGEKLSAVFPVGARFSPDGDGVAATVLRTGRSHRIDDYAVVADPIAKSARDRGTESSVGCPIEVHGTIWGAIVVGTTGAEPFPPEAEQRLTQFADLVATAVANAEARGENARLGHEQAALRRVATLVARDAPPSEVFDVVAMEVGKLLDTDVTVVGRYDGDGVATATGSWSSSPGGVPVGTRSAVGGHNVLTLVAETERPARVDGYDGASGEAAEIARRYGWRSSIAAPIIVEGRLWGVMLVATKRPELFPAGAEARLAAFTDLVATAIANAQAHDGLRRFGEEQAALGRVATLVAAGAAPVQVFTAVVEEVSSLLGLERIELVHYDGDVSGTVIAASGDHPFPAGTTWSLDDQSVMATVARTGRAARVDDYAGLKGEIAQAARGAGFRSAIGAPITVEGRLWGVIIAISTDPEPIPEPSEARLGQFTELVATAVANAEARDALAQLADEQAALRRVATLVAQETPPAAVFGAVAKEVGQLIRAERGFVARFEADDVVTIVGQWGVDGHGIAVGPLGRLDDAGLSRVIRETKGPARADASDDSWAGLPGVRRLGLRSAVAVPITVEGRLWGLVEVASTGEKPVPRGTEERLAHFTQLVATAIANAEARDALARLADEQAALRRVATLVAQGVQPDAIFSAVGEEIGRVFGSSITTVGRFEPGAQSLVALAVGTGNKGIPVGSRWELDDLVASAQVLRTGRSVRVDEVEWSDVRGPLAPIGRRLGVASTVASPIFVEGGLWGVVSVSDDEPLPPEAEDRLEKFSELIATAIANAESSAELAASRRRIVAAADEARRRIERDLHDGIQQRLIALGFWARAMTRRPPAELPAMAAELSEGLKDVSDELREVSRGIHPTILTEAGLGPALRALARRSAIPIDVDVDLEERLPAPAEAAAYYIASEALTNVAKHAHANVVELIATHDDGVLTLEVRDDGIGGVDAGRGSGILGLTDRVEALGGTISITSPPSGGTTLSVRLPTAAGD